MTDWFAGDVAARYDESTTGMPVEPVVDFLLPFAGGGRLVVPARIAVATPLATVATGVALDVQVAEAVMFWCVPSLSVASACGDASRVSSVARARWSALFTDATVVPGSSATSAALWKRPAGSFASSRAISASSQAGTSAFGERAGTGA